MNRTEERRKLSLSLRDQGIEEHLPYALSVTYFLVLVLFLLRLFEKNQYPQFLIPEIMRKLVC